MCFNLTSNMSGMFVFMVFVFIGKAGDRTSSKNNRSVKEVTHLVPSSAATGLPAVLFKMDIWQKVDIPVSLATLQGIPKGREGGVIPERVITNDELGRRHVVPVIFVRGTHYEVGFDVGRNFASVIRNYMENNDALNQFETEYKTKDGLLAYERTLKNMNAKFPYYVNEIQGVADGAAVPFHKLFLLQMDDIIETINENHITKSDTGGCSSIGVNTHTSTVLGHTEDALAVTLNHFYIVSAHVIPSAEDKARGAVEERFASLCYAGQMPGYTMGYNENGLVFSINTLSPLNLKPGNTPRTFLTRALLGAQNMIQAERILKDEGLGTANGFSVNMIWTTSGGQRQLYNIEVAPDVNNDRSLLNVERSGGGPLVHCNRYQRLKVTEVRGPIIDSSAARLATIHSYHSPQNRSDVAKILSDTTGKEFKVFQDQSDSIIQTIAAGIFDLDEGTWSIYIDKPMSSEPVAVLPINFSELP